MTNEKIFTLITKLHEKTERGEIDWEVTANSSRFATSSADYSILIGEQGDDYDLFIVDQFDELVERVSDVDLARDGFNDSLQIMRSLFSQARRNARGTDKVIDDILNSL
jgi:hypothetical protein